MNTNGNLYTFIYASALVIIVAAALSFTALKLQPIQEKNFRNEKMQDILSSVHIQSSPEDAHSKFAKYITKSFTINTSGNEIEGKVPFDINLKQEYKKKFKDRVLPLYEATLKDGSKKLIIPLTGTGLWGPIWGYIALNSDYNTIYGIVFASQSETPGLGAEIAKVWFQKPFEGKTIFENGQLVSITIYKGGKGAAVLAGDTKHGVDAISGGTITSKATQKMLLDCLTSYKIFLEKNKK